MRTALRIAEPADAMAVAHLHVKAWQAAYHTLLPEMYLHALRPEERAAKYDFAHIDPSKPRTIVATVGRLIHGFATTAPAQNVDDIPRCGELCALYVDPEWWGRGVGRALVAAARSHLVEVGFDTGVLWMLAGNTRADQFYRRDAWTPDGRSRRVTVWGVTIDEVRYVSPLRAATQPEVSSDIGCRV
jgi:GNAT superfamily N-acetyltransferase